MKRKFLAPAAITALLALVVQMAGCAMNSYNYYDGLSLPTEIEIQLINEPRSTVPGSPRLIHPLSFSIALATEKGLDTNGEFGEKYVYMQAIYRKALDAYLVNILGLAKYDGQIAGYSNAVFPLAADMQNYYQRHSMMGLEYLYLRNNIYIERLDIEDLALLEECYTHWQTEITSDIQDMVIRTYPAIIKLISNEQLAIEGQTDEIVSVMSRFGESAPNNALIIGYAYDYSDEIPHSEYVSILNYFHEEFAVQTSAALSEKLGIPVCVFEGYTAGSEPKYPAPKDTSSAEDSSSEAESLPPGLERLIGTRGKRKG